MPTACERATQVNAVAIKKLAGQIKTVKEQAVTRKQLGTKITDLVKRIEYGRNQAIKGAAEGLAKNINKSHEQMVKNINKVNQDLAKQINHAHQEMDKNMKAGVEKSISALEKKLDTKHEKALKTALDGMAKNINKSHEEMAKNINKVNQDLAKQINHAHLEMDKNMKAGVEKTVAGLEKKIDANHDKKLKSVYDFIRKNADASHADMAKQINKALADVTTRISKIEGRLGKIEQQVSKK